MNKHLILTPDENLSPVALPSGERVPLDFTVSDPSNNMLEGEVSAGVFTAKVAGRFRFSVSSQAANVIDYRVHIRDDVRAKDYTAQSAGNGVRLYAEKTVTLSLNQGDTVSFSDYQLDGNYDASRWQYTDTQRIEIEFLG